MSAPPNLIHIKRKRGDEDIPVTYLQLERGSKRHLTGSSWVYRRRIAGAKPGAKAAAVLTHHASSQQAKPIIQTSKPGDELSSPSRAPPKPAVSTAPSNDVKRAPEKQALAPAPAIVPGSQRPANSAAEPRRFHMSRSAMSSPGGSTILGAGVSKRGRYGTAVFVERGKKKAARKLVDAFDSDKNAAAAEAVGVPPDVNMREGAAAPAPKKPLAKRPPRPQAAAEVEAQRKPMPNVAPTQDMDKIAADMDQWVLHEIGLNLQAIEQRAPPQVTSPSRFKPTAPVKRFAERHPDLAKKLDGEDHDEAMTDGSDGDESDDDYVIEVYELAPSKPVLADIPPEEIGVLKFDSQEDMELFYGNEEDDSDYDDDEDENAENHYTADYPEDEVDSEDEYDRHAYLFRNANASDEEEYDLRDQDDDDEDMYVMEGDERRDEDDVFQDKIRRYIRKHGSS
ncbi:hypothetical protein CCHL11_03403 [Colletotrichum chlorophyti]|uniref:Transcription factor Iwr1 domain-containing protein n=1 Tax=Colletotrichum chlorophyti TaxID=708187 RepID=A0A1Q8RZX9_9PEZI|nr:hypothetical protein CCHL11_03403 [Colletotrichum chlorophyti]